MTLWSLVLRLCPLPITFVQYFISGPLRIKHIEVLNLRVKNGTSTWLFPNNI